MPSHNHPPRPTSRQTATIPSSNQTHTQNTVGTGHNVLLNNPLALVAATQASLTIHQSPQQVASPLLSRQNDSFSEATNKLRTKLPASHALITPNLTTSTTTPNHNHNHTPSNILQARPTYPVLPPPPNTRPARPAPTSAFRHPSSIPFRKPVPKLFRDPNTMSTPSPAVAPSPNLVTPANQTQALPATPSMALGEADLFAGLSLDPAMFKGARAPPRLLSLVPAAALSSSSSSPDPSKDDPNNFLFNLDTDRKFPPRSSRPLPLSRRLVNLAAAMLANPTPQTPQAQYTPAVVPNSPAIDLMSGIIGGPAVRQMPTLFASEGAQLGLMGMDTGAFGFAQAQDPFGSDIMTTPAFQDLQEILEQLNGTGPMTVSPRDLQAPPSSTFTSSPFTPVVAKPTPLLSTPASATAPLSVTPAHQASATDSGQKRTSPLSDVKSRIKRARSEEDGEQSASKRRKHTGTRPGITSGHLLPPGAPPQQKTYVTESSTSRKDVPASYKLKAGELPDDSALNKIVAKRTANRDSARRSRMRKQAAMEHAMQKVTIIGKRVEQLEDFIRALGHEPPAPLESLESPIMENDEDGD